jgi:hypothetical protein
MAADPRKRRKKLAKRTAKRKAKHHEMAREKSVGLPERMTAAAGYPILDSLVTTGLWDTGMGSVILSRELPAGGVAVAIFLVDRYCLGVKDAIAKIASRYEYDTEILHKMRSQSQFRPITPETARGFVESAVEYAGSLGMPPHPDYHRARLIFGDIDPAAATEQLEFGKDGKPLFIAGPNDTPARCRQIMATLQRAGVGDAELLMPVAPDELDSLEIADDDDDSLPDMRWGRR